MIPLRRGMIVKEHGRLIYPEGTACAQVLMAGEKEAPTPRPSSRASASDSSTAYSTTRMASMSSKQTPEKMLTWFKGGSISAEMTPELFGVAISSGRALRDHVPGGSSGLLGADSRD